MRKPLVIGNKTYKTKKAALFHYKTILNSYNFGQSLSENDFNDLVDLLDFESDNFQEEIEKNAIEPDEIEFSNNSNDEDSFEWELIDIKVSKVQFNTKCFEFFFNNGESDYISYINIINNSNASADFNFKRSCRNVIQEDIRKVKQVFFDTHSVKGQVKCQESGQLSKWEELAVDHRQPNTLSIIIDRFRELNNINVDDLEFEKSEDNKMVFKDKSLIDSFRAYHKEKANLRIVRKDLNSSRSSLARVKRTSKDLKIE